MRRGAAAVEAGSGEGANSHEPHETNLVDALANILHWVDCQNLALDGDEQMDFDNALRIARNHHSEERAGEV